MSELSQYYHEFACAAAWSHPDKAQCGCRGRGWWCSEVDTWHQCPVHGQGVHHPECECPACGGAAEAYVNEPTNEPVEGDNVPDEDDLPF